MSDRVRPGSEAAPWVVDEIKKLEMELQVATSFYKVAIKERDYERIRCNTLQQRLDKQYLKPCDCVYSRDGVPDPNCEVCGGVGALIMHD